jgi:thiosulfate sulfurtransferase
MEVPEIDIAGAQELLAGGTTKFVDVRDPNAYAAGHIPGALHLDDSSVHDFVDNTDKSDKVVVYCYHGRSSLGAAAYFQELGFTAVHSMSGGFTAWEAAGGAAERPARVADPPNRVVSRRLRVNVAASDPFVKREQPLSPRHSP